MSTNLHHNDNPTSNNHFQSGNKSLASSADPHLLGFQGDNASGSSTLQPQSTKSQVSNLTKTLQSSSSSSSGTSNLPQQQGHQGLVGHHLQGQQQHSSTTNPQELITGLPYNIREDRTNDTQQASYQNYYGAFPQQIPISQNSYKHMPMSHNTPTAVGTSYTSAHSYNPSLPSTNNFITQPESASFHDHTAPSSFRPNTVPHAFPTTTVQTDSAIPNRSSFSTAPDAASLLHLTSYSVPGNQFLRPSMINHPTQINHNQYLANQRIPNSLPVGHTYG